MNLLPFINLALIGGLRWWFAVLGSALFEITCWFVQHCLGLVVGCEISQLLCLCVCKERKRFVLCSEFVGIDAGHIPFATTNNSRCLPLYGVHFAFCFAEDQWGQIPSLVIEFIEA